MRKNVEKKCLKTNDFNTFPQFFKAESEKTMKMGPPNAGSAIASRLI